MKLVMMVGSIALAATACWRTSASPPAAPITQASRIAGDRNILPDPDTRTEIIASGKDRLVGTYKLCLTGLRAYDTKIQATIRDEWRYRPVLVNGTPAAVCSAATFIYAAPAPPPPQK